jgi:hypothetical protein
MWLEVNVSDGELPEVLEYLFAFFDKHLVRVYRAQTHVILRKRKRIVFIKIDLRADAQKTRGSHEGTNLDSPPPAEVNAPGAVLDGDAPAEGDEPAHLQRLDAIGQATNQLLRLGRPRVLRPVEVHLGGGRLDRTSRVARETDVMVEDRPRSERLSLFEEDGVGRVGFDGCCVRVRLPDWFALRGTGTRRTPGSCVGVGAWVGRAGSGMGGRAHVGRQANDGH